MTSANLSGRVRPAAVAGMFYPDEPQTLRRMVREFVDAGGHPNAATHPAPARRGSPWPKAIIAPHAGYAYSGPVAGSGYALLRPARGRIQRVVLIGPAHRVAFEGIATSSAVAFATPLGPVAVDRAAVAEALRLPCVRELDQAHAPEHSLEVHLPFLTEVLGQFQVAPFAFGRCTAEEVRQLLAQLWGGPETLLVVSSDLSHYHDHATAGRIDRSTAAAIEALRPEALGDDQACGRLAIQGLLAEAARRGLRPRTIDLRNSGDTGGPMDQVVGYGAFVFEEPGPDATPDPQVPAQGPLEPRLAPDERTVLLEVARRSIAEGLRGSGPLPVREDDYAPPLRQPRATFVTLHRHGALRGCIGTLEPTHALVLDVARNAYAAAFQDPRFPPLSQDELADLDVHISIIGSHEPMIFTSEAGLADQLRPGVDGLILEDVCLGVRHRATFLPSVWQALPDPMTFLRHLKCKAGLPAEHWSLTLKAWRYTTESVP